MERDLQTVEQDAAFAKYLSPPPQPLHYLLVTAHTCSHSAVVTPPALPAAHHLSPTNNATDYEAALAPQWRWRRGPPAAAAAGPNCGGLLHEPAAAPPPAPHKPPPVPLTQLDATGCGALVNEHGIIPGFSWGDAEHDVQALYTASNCHTKVCQYWRTAYGVVPYVSWGTLPTGYYQSWGLPRAGNKTCNSLAGDGYSTETCAALVISYNIIPGFSWGSTPEEAKPIYETSGCNTKMCSFWRTKYGVVPYVSWGTLPEAYHPSWELAWEGNKTCNSFSGAGYSAETCGALISIFNIIPGISWGTAPQEAIAMFEASGCLTKVCSYWRTKYDIVPYLSWGSLPQALHASWELPRPTEGGMTCNSLSGLYDYRTCGALVDTFGILLSSSWGTTPAEARPVYESSDCHSKVCEYWRLKYDVVPYSSWGSLPEPLHNTWDLPRANHGGKSCNALSTQSGTLDATACGVMATTLNIRPGVGWGTATPEAQQVFDRSNCEVKVCEYWRSLYDVQPFFSFGRLPQDLKAPWDYRRSLAGNQSCNTLSGPVDTPSCAEMSKALKIMPGIGWGSATENEKQLWLSSGCDARICKAWQAAFAIIPGKSWGALNPNPFTPSDPAKVYRTSWEWPRPQYDNQNCNTLAEAPIFPPDQAHAALARKFAPVLKFFSDARGYPSNPQAYFDAGCHTKACSEDQLLAKPFDAQAHVFYAVKTCGLSQQTRIKYHFFYAWQPPCGLTSSSKGEHQGDWEAITVILSTDKTRIAAVTYEQHGRHYTRLAAKNGFNLEGVRPVVNVGQLAHGSYHDNVASSVQGAACLYWGDARGGGISWNTGGAPLIDLLATPQQPWIDATRKAPSQDIKWEGNGEGVALSVDQFQPKCDTKACEGHGFDFTSLTVPIGRRLLAGAAAPTDVENPAAGTDPKTRSSKLDMSDVFSHGKTGCSKSQCKAGWKDMNLVGCYRCPKGYIDCGLSCAKGSDGWDCANPFNWNRKGYETEGYAFRIPMSDDGLL